MRLRLRRAPVLWMMALGLATPLLAQETKLPVDVPPDAEGAMFDDANKLEMFATSKTPKEVAKFYHDLAAQKGWQEQINETAAAGLVAATYSDKGKQLFTFVTIPGDDKIMVSISGPLLGTPE